MPNACPAVTFATRPWRLTGCGPNKGVDWLWCVHGQGLGWGKGSEGGSKESCSSWVGLPVIFWEMSHSNCSTFTINYRSSEWGSSTKTCFFFLRKLWGSYFFNEDKQNLKIHALCINELAGFWKGRPLTWNLFIKQGSYLTPHISGWVWMAETTQACCGTDCSIPLRLKHTRSLKIVPIHIKHRQNHNCIRGNRSHLARTNINHSYLTLQYGCK